MIASESDLSARDRRAWNSLKRWLSTDIDGRTLLELLVADPDAGSRVLLDRLQRRQVAPEVANQVSGGNVEKLVTIARAEAPIIITSAAPERPLEMKSGFAFVLERIVAFVFTLIIGGIVFGIIGGLIGGVAANENGALVGIVIGLVLALALAFINAANVSRRKGILVQ